MTALCQEEKEFMNYFWWHLTTLLRAKFLSNSLILV